LSIFIALPVSMFVADNGDAKDDLLKLMYELDHLKKMDDVRKYLV